MFVVVTDIQEYYETLLTFIDENKPMQEIEMESREVAKKWENTPTNYTETQVRTDNNKICWCKVMRSRSVLMVIWQEVRGNSVLDCRLFWGVFPFALYEFIFDDIF